MTSIHEINKLNFTYRKPSGEEHDQLILEVLKKIWDQENEEYQEYWDDLNAFWGDAD